MLFAIFDAYHIEQTSTEYRIWFLHHSIISSVKQTHI